MFFVLILISSPNTNQRYCYRFSDQKIYIQKLLPMSNCDSLLRVRLRANMCHTLYPAILSSLLEKDMQLPCLQPGRTKLRKTSCFVVELAFPAFDLPATSYWFLKREQMAQEAVTLSD
jgi:hypothetical protein